MQATESDTSTTRKRVSQIELSDHVRIGDSYTGLTRLRVVLGFAGIWPNPAGTAGQSTALPSKTAHLATMKSAGYRPNQGLVIKLNQLLSESEPE